MNKNRPVNLDIRTIKLPVAALASITHRIAGIVIFFSLPILLWMLDRSLASSASFDELLETMQNPLFKLMLWGIVAALIYHLLAGIKHLVLDLGWGYTLEQSQLATRILIGSAVVLILLAGVWICL
ncbi:MAG TPA: succinate dehydrogenase, cytochrome b556 subunit [Alcanivoracaceae bacterium]|nr:succinate dehydrogenase, cytochrome b556 subunit [Alcanivoracaceae bacterium]